MRRVLARLRPAALCWPLLTAAAAVAGAVPLQDPGSEDVLTLENGREVRGRILRVSRLEEKVYLAQGTRVRTVALGDVQQMAGPRVAVREYVSHLRRIYSEPPAAEDCQRLARWCQDKGLPEDARIQFWQTLARDASDATAHEALGHRKVRGQWRMQVSGLGLRSYSEACELRREFSHAWELRTTHFELKAAGHAREVFDAATSLEVFYAAFFETFQDTVGFFEVGEPIKVHIYPDVGSYPNLTSNQAGYFDPTSRIVYCYFQDGEAHRLRHEVVHALLHYTARETDRTTPRIPGWLDEGLAVYMDASFTGGPAAPRFEPGLRDQALFDAVRDARDLDSLQRVLNLQTGDFQTSGSQELTYAEAYTLTYFLLHGGGAELREGFDRFLRSVYERKGSPSHFQNSLGIRDLDRLERRWLQYVVQSGAPSEDGD